MKVDTSSCTRPRTNASQRYARYCLCCEPGTKFREYSYGTAGDHHGCLSSVYVSASLFLNARHDVYALKVLGLSLEANPLRIFIWVTEASWKAGQIFVCRLVIL